MSSESYSDLMAQREAIMRDSVGIDFASYATGRLAFDYERLLSDTGYDIERVCEVQRRTAVGNTPLVELHNITALARAVAAPGKGARILVKDEAANPSGSFKDRRASLSVYEAKRRGYKGVVAATSGNYGAAVASQAAKAGLKCIVVQEAFDSLRGRGGSPLGRPRAVHCSPPGIEGDRLLQRLALHSLLDPRHRDPWLRAGGADARRLWP